MKTTETNKMKTAKEYLKIAAKVKPDYTKKVKTEKIDLSFLRSYGTNSYESKKALAKALRDFATLNPDFKVLDFSAEEIIRLDFHSPNALAKFQGRYFQGFQFLKKDEKIAIIFGILKEENLKNVREEKEKILESRAYLQKEALDRFHTLQAKVKSRISLAIETEAKKAKK